MRMAGLRCRESFRRPLRRCSRKSGGVQPLHPANMEVTQTRLAEGRWGVAIFAIKEILRVLVNR